MPLSRKIMDVPLVENSKSVQGNQDLTNFSCISRKLWVHLAQWLAAWHNTATDNDGCRTHPNMEWKQIDVIFFKFQTAEKVRMLCVYEEAYNSLFKACLCLQSRHNNNISENSLKYSRSHRNSETMHVLETKFSFHRGRHLHKFAWKLWMCCSQTHSDWLRGHS